ncbi:MAG: MFS transporter [Myxococcales bacterium]|nr:MFS transporter [Myxococcales bacterium]
MTEKELAAAGGDPGFKTQFAYSFGLFPSGLLSGIMGAWLMYYYCPPADSGAVTYINPATFGFLMFLLNIPSALADPTVGHFSDRTRSRWGRRLPYILFGAPVLALSFVLLWFPPVHGESPFNVAWMFGTVLIYFLSFTAVVNPFLAIMPEIWQTEKGRMSVSSLMSVTQGVGTLLSFAAGALISALAGGVLFLGLKLNPYMVVGLLGGALCLLGYLPTLRYIRETPYNEKKEIPYSIWRSGWQTLKNPAFLPYLLSVAAVNTSTTLIIAMLPYQATVIAGSTEGIAGALLGALMLLAMLCLPLVNWITGKYPRRIVYLVCCFAMSVVIGLLYFSSALPGVPPLLFMGVVLFFAAPFVSVFLVVPRTILADVMDYDEKITGYRREAMYNGMESLIGKLPIGLAPWIMGLLFTHYGNTVANPAGIKLCAFASGGIALLAFVAFLFYPLKK